MKIKFLKSILTVAVVSFAMVACERDERFSQGSDEEEEQAVESASVSDDASDDVLEVVGQVETQMAASGGRTYASCATVTKDKENKIITIDFGDGCVGPYGRERSGKIFVAYSGIVGDSLSNRIITFENFFVNHKGVTGTVELRDIEINDAGNLQSTKKLVDLKITFPNGEYVVYNGSRTRELISGYADNDPSNNVYRITGSISGQSTTGRSFTQEITTPIIANWACAAEGNFARVSGVVEMTKLNGYVARKRIVNYGEGECDNVITITTFRRTFEVTVAD
ncbi:hypothetical protein WBG78_00525 [Chryseolinea sp. T2]|uniref:hypothetical protein n=1 Tax=Chryseolinea sp. T2 TaxID=3129255 RepID=UPI00307706E0